MGFSPPVDPVYPVLGPWADPSIMAPLLSLAAPVFAGSKPFLLPQLLSACSDLLPFPFVSPLSLFRRWLFAKRPQYLTGHNISQTAGLDRKPPIFPVG